MNQRGFTLIELIATMVIIGVITSVAIKKTVIAQDTSRHRAIDVAIVELRARETLTWTNLKFAGSYTSDAALFLLVDKNVGSRYHWIVEPTVTGGRLAFDSISRALTRTPSNEGEPGSWI